MTEEEKLAASLILSGYLATHALLDIIIAQLDGNKEEVELWALESLRKFAPIMKKYQAQLATSQDILNYIRYLEGRG